MSTQKPTFLFLPGGHCIPSLFNPIRATLTTHDYPSTSLSFPSISTTATQDANCDIAIIKTALFQLVDQQEKDVMLVMHSYSGLPGSEAVRGFGRDERAGKGKKGGVVGLVFIMAFMLPEGSCLAPDGDLTGKPELVDFDPEAGLLSVSPENAKKHFFNDIDDEVASKWASELLPQSPAVVSITTTYAAWRYIPTTFIICENDETMPVMHARMMVKQAMESSPNAIKMVETCDSGHFPFLSRVEWTADILRKAASMEVA